MSLDVDPMAVKIAQKLNNIRMAEREKIVLQNQLDALHEQTDVVKERLNRLNDVITSTKYEITHCMNDAASLTVAAKTGE